VRGRKHAAGGMWLYPVPAAGEPFQRERCDVVNGICHPQAGIPSRAQQRTGPDSRRFQSTWRCQGVTFGDADQPYDASRTGTMWLTPWMDQLDAADGPFGFIRAAAR
jgi:hypothetical protein